MDRQFSTSEAPDIAKALLDDGFARVALPASEAHTLTDLRQVATDFFTRTDADKRTFGSEDFNFGFRPSGRQYSVSADRPDFNESFAYWGEDAGPIPRAADIPGLLRAIGAYRKVVAGIADEALGSLAEHYSYKADLGFEPASCLETNWYFRSDDRDLLQDRHEDGHLLTLVTSDGPGLEIEIDGQMCPIEFGEYELLLMPGGVLTQMTGGRIAPLYHHVRNHRLDRRMSMLYLVNPALDRWISPYVETAENRDVDIAELARTNGMFFGLPQAPLSS